MGLDFVDLVLHGLSGLPTDSQDFVAHPKLASSSADHPPVFDSTEDFVRGSVQYANARFRNEFQKARDFLKTAERSIAVEKVSLLLRQIVYDRLVIALPKMAGASLHDLLFTLYSEYAKRPVTEMQSLARNTNEEVAAVWNARFPDEETLSADNLKSFYDSLAFPVACTFRRVIAPNLVVAQAALPLLLAQQVHPKAAFDFGGNSGLMTMTLAAAGVERCLLIDSSKQMIDFARWRDHRTGLANIDYLELDHIARVPDGLEGAFDFGICTEMLEHAYDVEATVSLMAKLLKKDGVLFQSASFGHYPHPTHLRRNLRYAGKEDELMAKFGMKRIQATFSVPLRGNERVYRKVA